jgi:hypothetical protein
MPKQPISKKHSANSEYAKQYEIYKAKKAEFCSQSNDQLDN